ncbi:hypothetical protein F0562_029601 [Nyssa sinensis]|uniref:Uncharacterized protein n=1 Tax=Nyssa sinensis TaxID=561372 RepID=A0A5J5B1P4_9ASTE|nr:hypothetical protein F0562_029601 [Nyssa sinensis]
MEMGRPISLRKGSWTEDEDQLLKTYVENYGEGNWKHIPVKSGLNRCRKSCRLRWLNYLRPNIKRGDFGVDEDDLIIRLHRLLGNRWSLIAGRIPGRTANDVKNHWNSYLSKKIASENKNTSSLENHIHCNDPMNLEAPEEGKLESSSYRKIDGEEEEEGDTTTFWKSLLLKGEFLETKLKVHENKETMVSEDGDLYQGLGDLIRDMEILDGSG